LVTGATRGIGRAIAWTLAEQGYTVIGTATTPAGALAITDALSPFAGTGLCLNVNDGPGLDAAVESITQQHGGLHVLVNNAGITRDMLSMRMKDDDWDAVIDTNLKAVFRLSRAAIRPMLKQRAGRIINITSIIGSSGNPGQANYAAAKAGGHDALHGPRAGQPRYHRQLHCAWLYRDRHDPRFNRGPNCAAA
jgi:3-oxoacyl-[acyl-carrier protein] reductase